MLREFNLRGIPVDCKEIEEFKVGSSISFYDEYTNEKGEGTIVSFAMDGCKPLAWYNSSSNGELHCVHLGWCKLK